MEGKASTSFREQVIFYYIQKFYCDAVNRYKHSTVGELDIYIPSIDVAIEYDGSHWHKSKLTGDNEKNTRAKEAGIKLIRIREHKLPSTENPFGEIYLPKNSFKLYDISYLNQIFNELGALIGNKDLRDYTIDEDGYKRNLPEIYSRIYDAPVEKNLEDMCGIEFWDEEFNGNLVPKNIPSNEWAYAILRCKEGKCIELPRYHRENKSQCKSEDEDICANCIAGVICPLIRWCQGINGQITDCRIVDEAVHRMIDKEQSYYRMDLSSYLSEWMWEKSTLGIRLVNEALLLKKNDPMRKNYIRFLGFRAEEKDDGISMGSIYVRDENEKKLLEKFAKGLRYTKLSVQILPCR